MEEKPKDRLIEFGKGTLILFLSFFINYIYGGFIGMFAKMFNLNMDGWWTSNLLNLLVTTLSLLTFLFIFRKRLKEEWKIFKDNKKECLRIGKNYWLIGLAVMVVSNIIINFIIMPGGIAANEAGNHEIIKSLPIYAIGAMVITGPILEELTYRASFKKAFKSMLPFVLFTGLLFGSVHLLASFESINDILVNWKDLLYIIPYGGLGVCFGIAYYKTDTIFTTFFFHILHNLITILLIALAWGLGA